jgi:hypothetical protein
VVETDAEVGRADARIAKVTRGWQNDVITDEEFIEQKADLVEQREAADAAARQASRRLEQAETEAESADANDALLDRMRELEVVADGLRRSADRDALRLMIAGLFSRVVYYAPGSALEIDGHLHTVGSDGSLALWEHDGVTEWGVPPGSEPTVDDRTCGHEFFAAGCDACRRYEDALFAAPRVPGESGPIASTRRVALPRSPVEPGDKPATTD